MQKLRPKQNKKFWIRVSSNLILLLKKLLLDFCR
jgi:hypothetical protein